MKRYLKSFLLFLKTKKFPRKEDLIELHNAPFSTSKGIFIIFIIIVLGLFFRLLLVISERWSIEVPDYGGTITEGVIGAPKFINPLLATSETDKALTSLVYAPLMNIVGDNLSPVLAKDCITSPDKKTYRCTLSGNEIFSDKSPLTSADVLFTFTTKKILETTRDPESSWKDISIETPNSLTVNISSVGNASELKEKLLLGILPKALWENIPLESISESNLNMSPIGAGAFKVDRVSYTNGLPVEVSLIPNPRFVGKKPYLKNLLVHSYTNQLDLASALHNHEIDSTIALKSAYIDSLIKSNFVLTPISTTKSVALWVSQKQSNSSTAQNIAFISNKIDRNLILDTIEHGYGIPLYSKETPRSSTATNKPVEETISIAVQKDTELLKIAEMLSLTLKEFNILATIQVFDQGLFVDQVTSGGYPFILMASPDAVPGYQRLIPLYTKSFVHITSRGTHAEIPQNISSLHESLSEANKWYKRTDRVWKWFTQK